MLGHVTIYGNLSGSNIKQICFVSFGPDETYNFIGSLQPMRYFAYLGLEKVVLLRAQWQLRAFPKRNYLPYGEDIIWAVKKSQGLVDCK